MPTDDDRFDAEAQATLASLRWYGPAPGAGTDARHTALARDRSTIAAALRSAHEAGAREAEEKLGRALAHETTYRQACAASAREAALLTTDLESKLAEAEKTIVALTKLLADVHAAIGNRASHGPNEDARCAIEWIEDAKTTFAEWRPVVEAAKRWRQRIAECGDEEEQALADAVDAFGGGT